MQRQVLPIEARAGSAVSLEAPLISFHLWPANGSYEIVDRQGHVVWRSNPYHPRFGEVTLNAGEKTQRVPLDRCEVSHSGDTLTATFHPLADRPAAWLRVRVRALADGKTLEFHYEAAETHPVESVRLLDDALWVTDAEKGNAVVPVREGLLVPADSGLTFTHRFDTYAYEGCHMEMLGIVKSGATALVTWVDPDVTAELRSELPGNLLAAGKQLLSPSLVLRQPAHSFRVQFEGKGDYVTIAKAYRQVAKERGWLITWDQKLKGHPERAKLFGAVDFKLWSALSRQMNEESTREESKQVNWTFAEAAQVAEHLKNDLKLDHVLFILGGWIHRGYDNQHPDILPPAPECGGSEGLAQCARRVERLGYLFCLHDNYQDMYRDAPSWNPDDLMKRPDGSLAVGGRWAGGRAYLICSQKAIELARRPQNLPGVKQLTHANAYFIDTTYADGLSECFDPHHPLTRADDMKWKQALSDYARDQFGIFGSEDGREWAIPHSDFFEGLTGVSGRDYHDAGLEKELGGASVPLFEIVYRDCIAMYGKYGYDFSQAAEYVLHHISIGRPLNYHSIPPHLYWKTAAREVEPLALRPAVAEVRQTAPHQIRITYRWTAEKPPSEDWRVFVHFTDPAGGIQFQGDYDPSPPTSRWPAGEFTQGPFTVTIPEGLTGVFDIRIGLFHTPAGERALLSGPHDSERRYLIGRLHVSPDRIEFEPEAAAPATSAGDPALFARADNGWAEGLHPVDRFIKNTYEILSPLNELTARMPLTEHQFLTPDHKVQRTVFGAGAGAVEVIVNASAADYRHESWTGGTVLLPPYGFLVEAPTFVAFHARSWNGLQYEAPVFFTLRSLDGRPLQRSRRIHIYHGFGDARVRVGGMVQTVRSEAAVAVPAPAAP